ncbi:chaperone protein DnaJ [Nitzschia inconspicua]|uniref:Chaperone protein DnaJ n=1 Tax=Nitzschia inconspicua TaxID=303405 RepID=A0A9K3LW79_9STRA|nr:chaperone protein DnaJ [Nitzschia inconspicua]
MEDGDNPYEVLGVPKDASESDIKKAYRKLALQHHPDKHTTEEGKQQATVIFAKISNSYEILSDPQKKREYDMGAGGSPYANDRDDFFRTAGGFHHTNNSFHFHDPFEVFNRVFRNEFARHNAAFNGNRNTGAFQDPFFGSPFGGVGSMRSSSLFDDPFFSGMGGGDPFFGGGMMGGGDPFAMMRQSMMNSSNMMNGTSSSFVQTISSSSGNIGGGQSVSTSTTTRIVNGQRQTVTETVIQKPDGTVERKVHTSGGNVSIDNGNRSTRRLLDQDPPEQPPRRQLLGPRHRSTSSGTARRQVANDSREQHQSLHEKPQPQQPLSPESAPPQRKKMKKRISSSNNSHKTPKYI